MPRGDGSGPAGMGPMTGRAAGYCAGYSAPGFANPVPGRGMGYGYGRGLGLGFRGGRRFYPQAGYAYAVPPAMPYGAVSTPQQEVEMLRNQAQNLENTLGQINQRITELEKEKESK